MKRLLVSLLLAMPALAGWSQMRWNQAYQNYIDQYKDLAIEQMQRYKIPASITLAQGLFESAAGRSDLVRQGNNHFGIKCHSSWTGPTQRHDDDKRQECFRVYTNARESFEDHSKFLARQQRYSRLFTLGMTNYRGWARGLRDCGYATNPAYADKLIQIIELYKLNEFDTAKSYDHFMADHTGRDVATTVQGLHPIMIFNENYYLQTRPGDTLEGIAAEVGISAKKLAKYNERPRSLPLQAGDVIYLKKKRKNAPKAYRSTPHVVKGGESLYYIAQLYGIQLKSLYKMNHLPADHQIQVGERLRLR